MDFSKVILKGFFKNDLERLLNDIPGSPLENINFSWVDLSGVPAELLARAVSHLHIVNLSNTYLTTDQCVKVLEASISSTTLVNLDLMGNIHLSGVPAELLAKVVARLHAVNLCNTYLKTDQCIKVLESSLSSNTLANVDMMGINLQEVPTELLAKAVSRLHTGNLCNINLTTDQYIKILDASLSSNTLANIELMHVNLSRVPADLLARAISRLHTVNLYNTSLTTDQCVKVLEVSLSSKTLVNVNLMSVKLCGVPPDLLARAVFRLQTVNLKWTYLTTDQCVKVLEASLSSTTLVNLNLMYVDLRGVPPNLLARAGSLLHPMKHG